MVDAPPEALPSQTHTLPLKERVERGRTLRERYSRKSNAEWSAPVERRDPVEILIEQGKDRVQELLPLRY